MAEGIFQFSSKVFHIYLEFTNPFGDYKLACVHPYSRKQNSWTGDKMAMSTMRDNGKNTQKYSSPWWNLNLQPPTFTRS